MERTTWARPRAVIGFAVRDKVDTPGWAGVNEEAEEDDDDDDDDEEEEEEEDFLFAMLSNDMLRL